MRFKFRCDHADAKGNDGIMPIVEHELKEGVCSRLMLTD